MTAQETEGAALAASFHLDDASLPDPTRSPGDAVRDAVADDLCDSPIEDFAKTPSKALCDDLFAEAGVSEASRFQYACVFVVPPPIGGSQSIANVWLQPVAEARLKATADVAVRKHVCRNPVELAEAQRLMASNWVAAYRKYLLPGDKLAPIKPEAHVPDAFSAAPPVPADLTPACGGSVGVTSAANDGGGSPPGQDDRRRRQGFTQDDRRRGDGRGAGEQSVQRRGEAARNADGSGQAEASRDATRTDHRGLADKRSGNEQRRLYSHDWPGGPRGGRNVGPYGGESGGNDRPAGSWAIEPHQSNDARGDDWRRRSQTDPQRNPDGRDLGRNPSPDSKGRRSLYARSQESPSDIRANDIRANDVRPNDVHPNDVRPNDVRPSDVRPSRPNLGLPRNPGFLHHARYRRHRSR